MAIPENQGGEIPVDAVGTSSGRGARGSANFDVSGIKAITSSIKDLKNEARDAAREVASLVRNVNGLNGGGLFGRSQNGGVESNLSTGTRSSIPSVARGPVLAPRAGGTGGGGTGGTGGTGTSPGGPPGGGGGGPGSGGGLGADVVNVLKGAVQPYIDVANATNARIARGAEYSLQADRMSVQLQQMYGMSNSQVRNQLRMPLTSHYLLGGGTAINDLLGMQASTGLDASKQASTVEAFRAVSGFSYGSGDVTRMLSTMASPDVANRMFMMGGTGMYGIGGKQRTGMQTIQDIVRRTGLTNPEALKGALQQGSNTRQRLTAMGVPADMQDMVIQYAMQNSQYQKKTGGTGMYDPSQESNRETMGIEGSYAVQHEKTTGERLKREERFYGRQVDNFAHFEKNLRTTTKALAALEDKLSGFLGNYIGIQGHPVTKAAGYYAQHAWTQTMNIVQTAVDAAGAAAGGDPIDSTSSAPKLSKNNEKKLSKVQGSFGAKVRAMLAENPALEINESIRSVETQDKHFKMRYTRRPDLKEKTKDTDRIWNNEVWVFDQHAEKGAPMAPPGRSLHQIGLAVDFVQNSENNEWLRANASRFGLETGATQRGDQGDEPFHVQQPGAQNNSGQGGGSVSKSSVSKSSVSSSVTPLYAKPKTTGSTPSYAPVNAGSRASEIERSGSMTSVNSIIKGIDKPVSVGGDPIERSGGGGGGGSITVAPNIYITGSQDFQGDLRRMAREVGSLLEKEVRLTMMRSS